MSSMTTINMSWVGGYDGMIRHDPKTSRATWMLTRDQPHGVDVLAEGEEADDLSAFRQLIDAYASASSIGAARDDE